MPAEPIKKRTARWLLLLGIVLVIAGTAAVGWILVREGKQPPAPLPPTAPAIDYAHLTRQKNLAVAHLENDQPQDAAPLFQQINEAWPQQILGLQNLAVARLLLLERGQIIADEAQAAANSLLRRDPMAATAHLLAGKIALAAADEKSAIAYLDEAVRLAPRDPAVLYALYAAARPSDDPAAQAKALSTLQRALLTEPENLFLLTELLLVQAENQDPAIAKTLSSAPASLTIVRDSILEQNKADVVKLAADALAAARAGRWPEVLRSVRPLVNVVRPQPATQSDRLRVDKNPLEYLLQEFDPPAPLPAEAPLPWTGVTMQVLIDKTISQINDPRDVELADFDMDGRLELIVLTASNLMVYGRDTNLSWRIIADHQDLKGYDRLEVADLDFDWVMTPARTAKPAPVSSKAAREDEPPVAKIDQDADVDIVVSGSAGVRVLRNEAGRNGSRRSFAVVAQPPAFDELKQVVGTAVLDADQDGDLDLLISAASGISLWTNRGDATLENISGRSRFPPADAQPTRMIPVDWDGDVDLDVILAGRSLNSTGYLENLLHGRFRWRPFPEKLQKELAGSAAVVMDADGRGGWDLTAATRKKLTVYPSWQTAPGAVKFPGLAPISSPAAESYDRLLPADIDNDGYFDLLAWGAAGLDIYRGQPGGRFSSVLSLAADKFAQPRTWALGDLDQDGDLDLAAATAEGIKLFLNQGGNRNHWLDVALRGAQVKGGQASASGRVPTHGTGAIVEVRSGPMRRTQIASGQMLHFGLGDRTTADVLRVLWPNGIPENVIKPSAGQTVYERQSLKGSCPYLYAWNGQQYAFVTDLLWAAPIGLQFAEGVYARPRAWEYIKVPGAMIQAKNGQYLLSITEEVWEAAYFDEVRLIAVDHPPDIQIFTNEKVGPPEIAAPKVHTVRRPRVPLVARDQTGRDVLALIEHRDDQYLKAFIRKMRQGLTEDHYLELDLGPLPGARQVTLFLSGWIYPSDTSLNVAGGHNPSLPVARPPSLLTPGENGQWREALPYMGFPGGKTKTIVLDISQLLTPGDHRLRIATNQELYWDQAFFTVDEEPAEFQQTELELTAAELRYRGFSRSVPLSINGPEVYDYQTLVDRQWPPMQGNFTRYGPVRTLLEASEDRMVVFGAGDELRLCFAAGDPPPQGWTRDFILYSVGYDKDADLNTIYGQTVEPLPFQAMSGYPYGADEAFPSTPQHQDYLRIYQTRKQRPTRVSAQSMD